MNRLDNFKDKSYTLTLEDRRKGGKVSSEKKRLANGLKNLKHGNNSSNHILLLRCSDCPHIFNCERKTDGYCSYLLEDLKNDKHFFKLVNRHLRYSKENEGVAFIVREIYRLREIFLQILEDKDIQQSSDSKG